MEKTIMVIDIKSEELEQFADKEQVIITGFLTYLEEVLNVSDVVQEDALYASIGAFVTCACLTEYLTSESGASIHRFFKSKFKEGQQLEQ